MSVDPQTQNLFDAILTTNYDRVKLAIDSGAAINSQNNRGQTPLLVACDRGNLEIVDLLLAAGAQMQLVQAPTLPVDETTYAFDIDEMLAASEDPLRPTTASKADMFVDSELTMTSLNNSTQQVAFEPSETYAFDLGRDLDRLTAESQEEPDCLSIPMGAWTANETYIMEDIDLSLPEIDDSGVNLAQLGILADFRIDDNSDLVDESFAEGETYAIDLDDLHLSELMGVVNPDLEPADPVGLSVNRQLVPPAETWEGGETYLIDLDDHQPIDPIAALTEDNTFAPDRNWEEGETYAIDLDDLHLSELMGGIDRQSSYPNPVLTAEFGTRSSGSMPAPATTTIPADSYLLAEIDSSLFPVIGGEDDDESEYDPDNEEITDIFGQLEAKQDYPTPAYDENATNTSLMAAVIEGDLDLVKQAIEAGASLDRYDWNLSYAPLGMAIDHGYLEIVECLLNAGTNPHCGSTSTTALGLAAENGATEIMQLLLARKVDVNTPIAPDGWTALLAAIQNGHRSVVQLLITAGANPNVWSRGETPILLAAKSEEREIYNYLYPLVNTAIRLCADRDGEHLLQATQKRRIRQQNRPIEKFIEMATEGNIDEVNRAIEIGIEIDELGAKGYTALMVAAYYGHRSVIKSLLAAGADPNLLSDDDGLGAGMTALMFATDSFFVTNRQHITQLLIAGGADVNQRGVGGKTAIFYAALAGAGDLDCVSTLIAAGADLDLHNDRGHTVLTSVATAENYAMLNLLMQAGAATTGLASIQLIQAAAAGNVDRVRSLLATNVNLDLDRGAAIGNAAAAGHTQIVELVIRAGANVHLTDKLGFSPIASAAYSGYGEIVSLLIAAGADLQAPASESQSYSALEYAQMGLYQFNPRPVSGFARVAATSTERDPRVDLQHEQIIRQLEQLMN